MLETKNKDSNYEFLNSKQIEIAPKIEELLIGLTVKKAQELLYTIRRAVKKTKIV